MTQISLQPAPEGEATVKAGERCSVLCNDTRYEGTIVDPHAAFGIRVRYTVELKGWDNQPIIATVEKVLDRKYIARRPWSSSANGDTDGND